MRQEKTNPKLDTKATSDNMHRGNYIAFKIQQDVDLIRGSGRTLICGSSRQLILIAYISVFCLKRKCVFLKGSLMDCKGNNF